jgi:hypothetical protein
MKLNTVYFAENLEFLKELNSEYIDLIYIDPPFFTGVDYKEFDDKWNSLNDYLSFMKLRMKEMYRVLKDSGSFYCHCDANAVFDLKLLCDEVRLKDGCANMIQSCIILNLIYTLSISNISPIRQTILRKCFDIRMRMGVSIEKDVVVNNI